MSLDTGEERQVERAGDLDGFQSEGGRAERESDRINHLRVHQQLGTLTTVSQASLRKERGEQTEIVNIQLYKLNLIGKRESERLKKKVIYVVCVCIFSPRASHSFFFLNFHGALKKNLKNNAVYMSHSGH